MLRALLLSLVVACPLLAEPDAPPATDAHVSVADDVTLHVRTFAANNAQPPVLMLTGGPGFAGEQLRATAEALAGARTVILPDQRGTGESNNAPPVIDPAVFNFAQSVSDLEALRTEMGVDRWSIAGHSWGALLAMLYASEHPERVESLALIAPAGIESSFWTTYQNNIFDNLTDTERQGIGEIPLPADESPEEISRYIRAANRAMAPAMLVNKDAAGALTAEITPENFNPAVSLSMNAQLQSYDLREDLNAFDRPVLVIQGDGDPIGRDAADTIVETLPNATLQTIENCGHWPMLETPDELNTTLAEFFKKK